MRSTVLIALLLLGTPSAPEEKFLPPQGLKGAKLILCAVGGNADKTADAEVVVQYEGSEYRAVISRRADVRESLEDCRIWLGHVKGEWK